MSTKIFNFFYIINNIGNKKNPILFYCPVCNDIYKTVEIYDYTAYHSFYEGINFFCNNCFSKFKTISDGKIILISKALIII